MVRVFVAVIEEARVLRVGDLVRVHVEERQVAALPDLVSELAGGDGDHVLEVFRADLGEQLADLRHVAQVEAAALMAGLERAQVRERVGEPPGGEVVLRGAEERDALGLHQPRRKPSLFLLDFGHVAQGVAPSPLRSEQRGQAAVQEQYGVVLVARRGQAGLREGRQVRLGHVAEVQRPLGRPELEEDFSFASAGHDRVRRNAGRAQFRRQRLQAAAGGARRAGHDRRLDFLEPEHLLQFIAREPARPRVVRVREELLASPGGLVEALLLDEAGQVLLERVEGARRGGLARRVGLAARGFLGAPEVRLDILRERIGHGQVERGELVGERLGLAVVAALDGGVGAAREVLRVQFGARAHAGGGAARLFGRRSSGVRGGEIVVNLERFLEPVVRHVPFGLAHRRAEEFSRPVRLRRPCGGGARRRRFDLFRLAGGRPRPVREVNGEQR